MKNCNYYYFVNMYCSQMMTQCVSLMVVLVGSVLQIADAVSCYQCNYTNSAFLGTSTCSEPFNATNTAKCSAPMCTWQFANYTTPMSESTATLCFYTVGLLTSLNLCQA